MRAAFFVLLLLPSVAAITVDDPAGDVAVLLDGNPVTTAPAGLQDHVDMTQWSFKEGQEHFWFNASFVAFPDVVPGLFGTGSQDTFVWADLTHGAQQYRLNLWRNVVNVDLIEMIASLDHVDPGTGRSLARHDLDAFQEDLTVGVQIPRDLLVDEAKTPPFPGRSIQIDGVLSRAGTDLTGVCITGATGCVPLPSMRDHADPGDLEVQSGAIQGDLRMATPRPYRLSNGAATSYVFPVEIRNLAASDQAIELGHGPLPDGWDGWWASPRLSLASAQVAEAIFVLHVPFTHVHGRQVTVALQATAPDATGALEVGVTFSDVGYPSGHHDTVYLHAAHDKDCVATACTNFPPRWMNTLRDDPDDHATALDEGGYALSPATLVGLHFTHERVGHVTGTVVASQDVDEAELTVRVGVRTEQPDNRSRPWLYEEVLLGTAWLGSEAGGDSVDVALDLDLVGQTERFPYQERQNLYVVVTLLATNDLAVQPSAAGLQLEAGAAIQLPLLDWTDDVEAVVRGDASVGNLELTVETPHRRINPGKAAVFNVTALTQGAMDVRLDLLGSHADWATFGAPERELPLGASTIQVAVTPPETALDGQTADLYLRVTDAEGAVAVAHFVAEVDVDAASVDQSDLAKQIAAPETKGTPMPGPILALLGAFWWARRRQSPPTT